MKIHFKWYEIDIKKYRMQLFRRVEEKILIWAELSVDNFRTPLEISA